MQKFLTRLLITTLAALAVAYLLSGVTIDGFGTAIIVALVLALLNTFIKPILIILTIPITILTLGLFLLVINILIVKLAAYLVNGFYVDSWFSALLFSILLSITTYILESMLGIKDENK